MSLFKITETLYTNYRNQNLIDRPFIVAIDGLGGAGKTTITNHIRHELEKKNCEVTIIHIDDYIVETKERYLTDNEEWYEYYYLQWDISLLQTELYEKLHKQKRKLSLPYYDRSNDTVLTKEMHVSPQMILLIEGVFIQRKEWKDFYDFTIFIDCPRELRAERVLNRDSYLGDDKAILDKYRNRYWVAEEYYMNQEDPIKNADLIYRYKKGKNTE